MIKRAAVYCGTRNLYPNMITAAKSLLLHSDVEKIYFLTEDDDFPFVLPPKTENINISNQTYFNKNGPNYNSSWTYMVLIRAALSKIFLDLDCILSLDVDTIVNENISDIWNIPLDDYYLAGVREPEKSTQEYPYVNLGVILFNLKKLREDKKDDEIIYSLNTKKYDYNEQDCINELCRGYIAELEPDYNVSNYTATAKHRKIIHYAQIKGWQQLPLVKHYERRQDLFDTNFKDNFGLSIIIPTYNNKKGLIKTLSSIVTFRSDVEIIIIDDNSNPSYMKDILIQFPYVRYFYKSKNEGPGIARQEGIQYSLFPYVMFIDTGDYLLPGCLNMIMDKIYENTMPDVYNWRWLNEENNTFSGEWNPLMHGHVYKKEFLDFYDITFCRESPYSNEDIGFNHTCDMILHHISTYDNTVHRLFCETPVYMYTYDKNSITHANKKEFYYTKQVRGLALNGIHIIRKGEENKVCDEALFTELTALMVGLYSNFLRCLARPDILQENWNWIRKFYFEAYQKYEDKCDDYLTMAFGRKMKELVKKYPMRLNIKKFLYELKNFDIIPDYYLTKK